MAVVTRAQESAVGARGLVVAALGPIAAGYLGVAVVLGLVTGTAPDSGFSLGGVLSSALPGWLAVHQVPLVIDGRELGVLPLLPTILIGLLVARAARSAADRADAWGLRETGRVAGVVVLAHAATGMTAALLVTGSVEVDPLAGLYYPALVALVAVTAGLLPRSEVFGELGYRVDELAVRGFRAGALACAGLAVSGALLFFAGLAGSFGAVQDMFSVDAGVGTGLFLLSLGYLPNAVVAGLGFAAGPGFTVGQATVSPLDFTPGPLPPVPLLQAVPAEQAAWWPAVFALPLLVGALTGWVLRDAHPSPAGRVRAVAVAALVVAVAAAIAAGSAGGALAGGPFDPVDLRAPLLSLTLACWIGVPAALVAWLTGYPADPRPRRSAPRGASSASSAGSAGSAASAGSASSAATAASPGEADTAASPAEADDGPVDAETAASPDDAETAASPSAGSALTADSAASPEPDDDEPVSVSSDSPEEAVPEGAKSEEDGAGRRGEGADQDR